MNDNNTLRFDELAADLEAYVRDAVDILDSGDYVELTRLEGKVAHLCRSVVDMQPQHTLHCRERLEGLMKQLDLLQTIMEEHKQKVQEQLQGLDVKQRASKAYAKSDAMAPLHLMKDSE